MNARFPSFTLTRTSQNQCVLCVFRCVATVLDWRVTLTQVVSRSARILESVLESHHQPYARSHLHNVELESLT